MPVTVAAIQMHAVPFTVPRNLHHARGLVCEAVARGANLVVLPAYFNSGISGNTLAALDYAEPIDGVTVAWMCDGATRLGCYLAGAVLIRSCGKTDLAMLLATPGGTVHHAGVRSECPDHPGSTAATALGSIGLLRDVDLDWPEHCAATALHTTVLLLSAARLASASDYLEYPDGRVTALPSLTRFAGRQPAALPDDDDHRRLCRLAALYSRPVVYANQCGVARMPLRGNDNQRQPADGYPFVRGAFSGHSAVIAADGRVLACLPDAEGVVVATIEYDLAGVAAQPQGIAQQPPATAVYAGSSQPGLN